MPFDDLGVTIEHKWIVTCHEKDCGKQTTRKTMQEAQRAAIDHRRRHITAAIAAGEDAHQFRAASQLDPRDATGGAS